MLGMGRHTHAYSSASAERQVVQRRDERRRVRRRAPSGAGSSGDPAGQGGNDLSAAQEDADECAAGAKRGLSFGAFEDEPNDAAGDGDGLAPETNAGIRACGREVAYHAAETFSASTSAIRRPIVRRPTPSSAATAFRGTNGSGSTLLARSI
jgi:hypothetical protein